jgi:hypothetical protein
MAADQKIGDLCDEFLTFVFLSFLRASSCSSVVKLAFGLDLGLGLGVDLPLRPSRPLR